MDTPKFIYAGNPDTKMKWLFIPDTLEARDKAIADGCNAFTTMSFDYEPEQGKPEPTRYGSLWLDVDCKGSPEKAVTAARSCVVILRDRYSIDVRALRYFLSGSKGAHIEIPAAIFGGTEGHPYLPIIHRNMLELLFKLPGLFLDRSLLDTSLYSMSKGHLLRAPYIRRPDGNYKVQLSHDEFMHGEMNDILMLVKLPRTAAPIPFVAPEESSMTDLYDAAKSMVVASLKNRDSKKMFDAIMQCDFIQHCLDNQETLSEPEWFGMVGLLMRCGEEARPLVHEFSRGYPRYSYEETEAKIGYAKNTATKVTCKYIQEVYTCNRTDCKVRGPLDLYHKNAARHEIAATAFMVKADGVYYSASSGVEDDGIRLCSPMSVLGKMRNPDGVSWSRLVEFSAPDGQTKKLCIPMRDCTGRGDAVRSLLSDHGLEISMNARTNMLLMEYIQHGGPDDAIFLQMDKVGWYNNTYVLPDAQFGENLQEKIYFEAGSDSLHACSGTLQEWQEHVGRYCQENSLLVLAASYALTGVLLRPCGMEGGGLHIYGASSTGKTTAGLVAGSICGGGGNRGYLRQWRSTHNALENTAAMHNDGLLVLDEVGQATAEAVSQVAYMLPNGQAKGRMKSDATARKVLTWRLNFLSTGELTINDKIEETGKLKSMAGQMVRIIDLPVDAGAGRNLFQNLHGLPDTATLSNVLSNSSLAFYGTPIRAFLEWFCQEKDSCTQRICAALDDFERKSVPAGASGQVRRVARKFGLIAIAGELAIEWGIFPLNKGDADAAAREWFAIWLEQRGGHGDVEMEKVLKRIQDHFAVERSRYVQITPVNSYQPTHLAGYTWTQDGRPVYLMLSQVLENLARGVNRKLLKQEMQKKGWLVCNSNGVLMETKSVGKRNVRGVVFIPAAWEGSPEASIKAQHLTPDNSELF